MFDNKNEKEPGKPDLPQQLPPRANKAAFAVFLSLAVLFGALFLFNDTSSSKEIPYSAFISYLDLGEVDSVQIIDQKDIEGTLKEAPVSRFSSKRQFRTLIRICFPECGRRISRFRVQSAVQVHCRFFSS